ncbi:MAG: hypothetical protein AAB433_15245 [Nitrospirota bacterium]
MPRTLPSQVVKTIEQLFPDFVKGEGCTSLVSGMSDMIFKFQAVLDLVEQIPPELITLKDEEYTKFSVSVSAISWNLKHPAERDRGGFVIHLHPIREFWNVNPIALLYDMLRKCPDEFPSANTNELQFVEDTDFRQSLRNDLSAIGRALANSEWKAATVLAGSVVESLLLWKLDKDQAKAMTTNHIKGKKLPSIERWDLHDYIEVAAELTLIGENAAKQARLAKDYRNLIHPGRTIRLGTACNRGTAFGAVAAVELVIEDLSRTETV